MQKPIMHKTVEEWTADIIHSLQPYGNKTKLKKWDWTAIGRYDEIELTFSRKVRGYTHYLYELSYLKKFYGAEYCAFDTDGGIDIHFRSWNDVETDEDGCVTKIKKLKISA